MDLRCFNRSDAFPYPQNTNTNEPITVPRDRVKDARALAAISEGPELPEDLASGGTWLHWLQNAIPTINLMPAEFTEDDEYIRLQTELRLLRDGAKYTPSATSPSKSLDEPTIISLTQ